MAGYLFGGLKGSRLNRLDWNEERARNYRQESQYIAYVGGLGAGIGAAGAGVAAALGVGPLLELGLKIGFGIIGGVISDDPVRHLKEWPPRGRKNLAHKGLVGRILSEYDYNNDGTVDLLEYTFAWQIGARKSQVDFNHSGTSTISQDPWEVFSYFKYHNDIDYQIMTFLNY